MITLQQSALDLLIQVTLWSTLGLFVLIMVNRYLPYRLAQTALCFLTGIIVLTVLVWFPWPLWVMQSLEPDRSTTTLTSQQIESDGTSFRSFDVSIPLAWKAWQQMLPALPHADTTAQQALTSFPWTYPIFAIFLMGVIVGGSRLHHAYRFAQAYLAESFTINDPALSMLLKSLADQLRLKTPVRLLVSPSLNVPATIGFWKPVILLPVNWQTWSADECRTVLAHELAHIARSDYLMMVLTQCITIMYWFHPLICWLSRCTRAGQELAADALAVRVHGDKASYLRCLARLALVQDGVRLPAPARLFLSPEVSLLRRIAMLRDGSRRVLDARFSLRCMFVVFAFLAGAVIAALRSPAHAVDGVKSSSASVAWQRYINPGVAGYMVLQPSKALSLDSMKEWREPLNQMICNQVNLIPGTRGIGIPIEAIECCAGAIEIKLVTDQTPRNLSIGSRIQYLRLCRPEDAQAWIKACTLNLQKVEVSQGTYYKVISNEKDSKPGSCLLRPDDRTIVFAESEQEALAWLTNEKSPTTRPAWLAACPTDTGVVTMCIDTRHELLKQIMQQSKQATKPNPAIMPLLDFEGSVACTVPLADHLKLFISMHCKDEASAVASFKQFTGILNMFKLIQVGANAAGNQEKEAAATQTLVQLLNNSKSTQNGAVIEFHTECSMTLGELMKQEVFKGASINSTDK